MLPDADRLDYQTIVTPVWAGIVQEILPADPSRLVVIFDGYDAGGTWGVEARGMGITGIRYSQAPFANVTVKYKDEGPIAGAAWHQIQGQVGGTLRIYTVRYRG